MKLAKCLQFHGRLSKVLQNVSALLRLDKIRKWAKNVLNTLGKKLASKLELNYTALDASRNMRKICYKKTYFKILNFSLRVGVPT